MVISCWSFRVANDTAAAIAALYSGFGIVAAVELQPWRWKLCGLFERALDM